MKTDKKSLWKARGECTFYYIIVFILSYVCIKYLPMDHLILRTFLADLVGTFFIYIMSEIRHNASLYDPYWSVYPPFIALSWYYYSKNLGLQGSALVPIIIIILVFIWAVRLTLNWAIGWKGMNHEDWRYVELRNKSGKWFWFVNLTGIQLMPTLLVFTGSLSLYPSMFYRGQINAGHVIGVIVIIIAIYFEAVADWQLRKFNKTKKPEEIMDRGLWKYSRHPNYFGEVSFWWGLYICGVSSNLCYWWTIIGPIAITILFLFISIPLMERRSLQRRPGYAEHMKRVSKFFPRPPKR